MNTGMNIRMSGRGLVAAVVIAAAFHVTHPSQAESQGVSIAVTSAQSSESKALGSMTGFQAFYTVPIGARRISTRYGLSYNRGSRGEVGSLCSGLIDPNACAPEPLNLYRRLSTVSAGIGHFGFRDRAVRVHTYGDITAGSALIEDKGRSGDSRSASKATLGIRGGVEGQWKPTSTFPFRVQLGVAMEGVKPLLVNKCADCFMPFNDGFAMSRIYLGLSFGRPTPATLQ